MVSKEFIYARLKSNHTISVHMNGESRLDGLSPIIYVIHEMVLDEKEEKNLLWNIKNRIDTQGTIKIIAERTSEVDFSVMDSEPKEYVINTIDIVDYEIVQ